MSLRADAPIFVPAAGLNNSHMQKPQTAKSPAFHKPSFRRSQRRRNEKNTSRQIQSKHEPTKHRARCGHPRPPSRCGDSFGQEHLESAVSSLGLTDASQFPLLSTPVSSSLSVSAFWADASLRLGREAATQPTERSPKNALEDAKLTLLGKVSDQTKSDITEYRDEDGYLASEDSLPDVDHDDDILAPCQTYRRRRLDINKMRDRWWKLLREHHERIVANAKKFEEDAATDEESSTFEDTAAEYRCLGNNSSSLGKPSKENSAPELDASYLEEQYPIYLAIQRNDAQALRVLLQDSSEVGFETLHDQTPLQYATILNRPNMLRILLKSGMDQSERSEAFPPPFVIAAECGNDEIVQLFMADHSAAIMLRDVDGNTVLHTCCSSLSATVSILHLILDCNATNSLLPKVLLSKNNVGQTPLHLACQHGRVDFVDLFLSSLYLSVLSKMLTAKDDHDETPLLTAIASASTDIVMSLLMWRGNNHITAVTQNGRCPLAWAVRSGNIDMVLLLLEFSGRSKNGYDLVGALREAVQSEADCEILKLLVEAGANPCANSTASGSSALAMAVIRHDASSLASLLDSYNSYLSRVRDARKRDPILQKQPESFFAGMESKENAEKLSSMRDALVICLFHGCMSRNCLSPYYDCCRILYVLDATFGTSGLERLKESLAVKKLSSTTVKATRSSTFETRYSLSFYSNSSASAGISSFWHHALLSLPWFRVSDCRHCRSMESVLKRRVIEIPCPDMVLISEDGFRFDAHSDIVCLQSGKLAAASRFATMNNSNAVVVEVDISLPSRLAALMLQHIYAGSIVCGLEEDTYQLVEDLLSLMMFGEESLCPSLMQECEMRLLSSDPWLCYCSECSSLRNDCHGYEVFGPSCCINASNAIDVLAVSQHVSDSVLNTDCYEFEEGAPCREKAGAEATSASAKRVDPRTFQPVAALRQVAVSVILMDMSSVVQSESFASFRGDDTNTSINTLLHSCLEQLEASVLGINYNLLGLLDRFRLQLARAQPAQP